MTHEILIASTNKYKIEEIKQILQVSGWKFLSLLNYRGISAVEENGKTFTENAEIKAKHYYTLTGKPVIADDSGLVVPALNGEPGVLSARFAGTGASYPENNQLLLKRMDHIYDQDRYAYFVCVLVYFDGKKIISAEGRAEGTIIGLPRGEGGFGYDPLFYYAPAKKTFAEMTAREKNQVSHRAQALRMLRRNLAGLYKE
jgi:XTP/dITP diphosphohydrolase